LSSKNNSDLNSYFDDLKKKHKFYFGIGYSLIIFTDNTVKNGYPVFDAIETDFTGQLSLFTCFRLIKSLSLELEPSYIFVLNHRNVALNVSPPVTFNSTSYSYAHPSRLNMYAFPIMLNLRFFPASASKGFGSRIYIGGGGGIMYIHESYDDVVYSNDANPVPYPYNGVPVVPNITNSQWAPMFGFMTGFTGSSGPFAIGAEIKYNIVSLKKSSDAFITRSANNFNNVSLTLRFYFNQ